MNASTWDLIFHPTDFSEGDEGALTHALKLTLLCKAELDLLHTGADDASLSWEKFPRVRTILERWGVIPAGVSHKEMRDRLGIDVKKIRKKAPDVVSTIVDQINENRPDLIVLATHQRKGVERWMHRAIAEPIARKAGRLTLFVPRRVVGFVSRETGAVRLKNILIPIDHSPSGQIGVDAAIELAHAARATDVQFTLLYVGTETDMPPISTPEVAGWHFERNAWEGNVVERILEVAEEQDADLICMATDGADGFLGALRGSTTERVLRAVKCPLLAARAD